MKKGDGPGWTAFGRILRSSTNSEQRTFFNWMGGKDFNDTLPSREECDRQLPIRAEHTNYGAKI